MLWSHRPVCSGVSLVPTCVHGSRPISQGSGPALWTGEGWELESVGQRPTGIGWSSGAVAAGLALGWGQNLELYLLECAGLSQKFGFASTCMGLGFVDTN